MSITCKIDGNFGNALQVFCFPKSCINENSGKCQEQLKESDQNLLGFDVIMQPHPSLLLYVFILMYVFNLSRESQVSNLYYKVSPSMNKVDCYYLVLQKI